MNSKVWIRVKEGTQGIQIINAIKSWMALQNTDLTRCKMGIDKIYDVDNIIE